METETVHLEMVESHIEVWLDRDRAVIRMVMDLSKPVQGFSVFMVWNVETPLTGADWTRPRRAVIVSET